MLFRRSEVDQTIIKGRQNFAHCPPDLDDLSPPQKDTGNGGRRSFRSKKGWAKSRSALNNGRTTSNTILDPIYFDA